MGRYHNRIVCLGVSLRAEHPLDGVAGEGVEEEREEDDEAEPEEDLDDGPLVVVPDDVTDRLDRVQEPHERRVRTPTEEMNTKFACFKLGPRLCEFGALVSLHVGRKFTQPMA